ncbi:MAG: alpha-glucuronidase [Prevotella sp.]|nr:alpha-glucuronidase [Prevotella sp.]
MKQLLAIIVLLAALTARGEDGHALWLRLQANGQPADVSWTCVGDNGYQPSATLQVAMAELKGYWKGAPITLSLVSGHRQGLFGKEGFRIQRQGSGLTIRSHSEIGLLYGAYYLLRQQQTGEAVEVGEQHPAFSLRVLNHWDNLNGSIERGYAGRSIFWWNGRPDRNRDQWKEYGRANASIGINGTVLNNVNASPRMLATEYLDSVRQIADVLRPYGMRVYLSVNFASPMSVAVGSVNGGKVLSTADPLDPQVAAWWQQKVAEIYRAIPDFGGFLVKANSEGQPGPGDYHRSHADGANMLADAIAPYGGIIMWRAFVYGYHEGATDRVMKAVNEFQPLDGQFRKNVIIQIKNGPLDFQPREPYSPLFDQLKQTPMMAELQITQEYLGQSRHLVYHGPMWKEFFGFVSPSTLTGVAGVANIGLDSNWCGHHFSQANWYVYGRLAWDPGQSSATIAREWLSQTFTTDAGFVNAMTELMESSHEACVNYMMPLGLHHIFKGDHHYGPEPEGNQPNFPDEWKPVWYHKAGKDGIGFNRSTHGGTGASQQYRQPFSSIYDDPQSCPEEYLLWFHHLPWDYRMTDGTTLWESLQAHYDEGVKAVETMVTSWAAIGRKYVDQRRYDEVSSRLQHQLENAREWRTHCLNYFRQFAE